MLRSLGATQDTEDTENTEMIATKRHKMFSHEFTRIGTFFDTD